MIEEELKLSKEQKEWITEFIKKHTARGSHRWAFWCEGIIIGLIIGTLII
tara:strand:- start:4960 stop:5109 length:150 start_codon:yes stop_codon:yes gene_type:complete